MRLALLLLAVAGCASLTGLDGFGVGEAGDGGDAQVASAGEGGAAQGGAAQGGAAQGGSMGTGGALGGGGANNSGGAASGGSSPTFCDEPGLVICYEFDGDAIDGSAAGNDAATSGVSYVAGRVGQAVEHGGGDVIAIPTDGTLGLAAYTQEMWLYPTSLPSAGRRAILDAQNRWSAWLDGQGVRCRGVQGPTIPVDTWTHFACVHDSGTLRVFVDGTEVASGSASLDNSAPADDVHIGSDAPGGGDAWVGRIDQLRIFDHPRTPAQICTAAGRSGC